MLVEALDEHFAALIAGEAPSGLRLPDGPVESTEVLQMLRDLANTIRPLFAPAAWLVVEDAEIVGLCSIVRSPADGVIDIGYGVASTRRRSGHASHAVGAVVDWAGADPRVTVVRAETSIHNLPSRRVLLRNGFERSGRRTDSEDGELDCWRKDLAR